MTSAKSVDESGTVSPDKNAAEGTLLRGSIHPKVLWAYLRSQHAGFQIACLYMFFEYVRPQSRFPAIDIIPWTQTIVIAGFIAMIPEISRYGRTKSAINFWIVTYLLVAAISLLFADYPQYGIEHWDNLLPWIIIFFLLTNTTTSRNRFLLLFLVYVLCNIRLSQFGLRTFFMAGFSMPGFGFRGPVGWFQNSGELGVQMAMFTPVGLLIAFGLSDRFGRFGKAILILIPLSALLTTVGTNSRGAIIAGAAATCWALLAMGVRIKNLVTAGALTGIGMFLISDKMMERFDAMGEDATSLRRITFIKDGLKIIGEHPIFGVGYSNWIPYYSANFPAVDNVRYLASHQLPHNILIQVTAELGLVGLSVFLILLLLSFLTNRRTRRMLGPDDKFLKLMSHGLDASMLAFFIAGQFVTVLYYPYFWINLALTVALHESCRRDLFRRKAEQPRRGRRRGVSPQGAS